MRPRRSTSNSKLCQVLFLVCIGMLMGSVKSQAQSLDEEIEFLEDSLATDSLSGDEVASEEAPLDELTDRSNLTKAPKTEFKTASETTPQPVEPELGLKRSPSDSQNEVLEGPPNGQGGWVIVETPPSLVYAKGEDGSLLPYVERRTEWSLMGSFGYSWFLPSNYEPTVGPFASYSDLYNDNPDSPLLELQFTLKRNFNFGSFGLDLGAGIFSTQSKIEGVDSRLDISIYRVGVTLLLDTLFREPWVAPYASAGGYVIQKKEVIDSTSDNESTQIAPYYALGLLFQLNWIDPLTALTAYSEIGLENTYLFAEGRQLFSSSEEADSDFGTEIFAIAGVRIEL